MNCANHQQVPAASYCRTCGKPLCESCRREVQGLIYCEQCIATHVPGVPAATVMNPQAPNPGLAFVLGFIPGVGAMYCGEFAKALVHVGVFVALIVATNEVSEYFGILIPFWIFYMVFDSFQTARAKQEGRPVPDFFGLSTSSAAGSTTASASNVSTPAVPLIDPNRSQNMPIGPVILIVLGVLFLLHTMGLFRIYRIPSLWPFALLGLGGWLIWQRTQRAVCRCVSCTAISLLGPSILVTVGIMGLLAEFTRISFWESAPLILIVIGVLKLLQITGSREGHIGPGSPPMGTPPPDSSSSASSQNEVSHG
jgi:hypothetical protein